MKNSIMLALIFLLLACSSFAAPLQLSGASGRAILGTIDLNNSTNETNPINETQLWSWGKLPLGHFINTSGKLAANPINDDGLVVVPPRSDG
ncbi:MAG: hypothetical protein ACYDHX_03200 [Methanothrix sp.]